MPFTSSTQQTDLWRQLSCSSTNYHVYNSLNPLSFSRDRALYRDKLFLMPYANINVMSKCLYKIFEWTEPIYLYNSSKVEKQHFLYLKFVEIIWMKTLVGLNAWFNFDQQSQLTKLNWLKSMQVEALQYRSQIKIKRANRCRKLLQKSANGVCSMFGSTPCPNYRPVTAANSSCPYNA